MLSKNPPIPRLRSKGLGDLGLQSSQASWLTLCPPRCGVCKSEGPQKLPGRGIFFTDEAQRTCSPCHRGATPAHATGPTAITPESRCEPVPSTRSQDPAWARSRSQRKSVLREGRTACMKPRPRVSARDGPQTPAQPIPAASGSLRGDHAKNAEASESGKTALQVQGCLPCCSPASSPGPLSAPSP